MPDDDLLAELLRETESTARIPILAFTAKDVTAEEREQLRAVSAIVTKGSAAGKRLIHAIQSLDAATTRA